jgi:hypothetical protein
VPKTTEELIEMGKYMLYANTAFMEKMETEIRVMIHEMIQMMDIRSLTQEHIDLNTKTILWVQNIKPVFKHNSLVSSLKHLFHLFSYLAYSK